MQGALHACGVHLRRLLALSTVGQTSRKAEAHAALWILPRSSLEASATILAM